MMMAERSTRKKEGCSLGGVRMRSGAKMVFFNIAVFEKNGQRVVEGTELESDLEELHSDSIASQRKGTHKIQTPMFYL